MGLALIFASASASRNPAAPAPGHAWTGQQYPQCGLQPHVFSAQAQADLYNYGVINGHTWRPNPNYHNLPRNKMKSMAKYSASGQKMCPFADCTPPTPGCGRFCKKDKELCVPCQERLWPGSRARNDKKRRDNQGRAMRAAIERDHANRALATQAQASH